MNETPTTPLIVGACVRRGISTAMKSAIESGCDCAQIYLGSPRRWEARVPSVNVINEFCRVKRESGIIVALHCAYITQLASAYPEQVQKSISRLTLELMVAGMLNIEFLVLHPGKMPCGISQQEAVKRIAAGIDAAILKSGNHTTQVLLESMPGAGRSAGGRLEELAQIIGSSTYKDQLGICLDTAHLYSAGYNLRTYTGFHSTMDEIADMIGWERVKFMHLTDTTYPLGSHVDRHVLPGKGKLGEKTFRYIVNDPRLSGVPMCIESGRAADSIECMEKRDWLRSLQEQEVTAGRKRK